MFSNFSPASWRVVRVAEQEARNHNDYFIGAEHLLVALLEERDVKVLAALRDAHIDAEDLYADARRSLGFGADRLWEGIVVTPRVRKIVALAERSCAGREIEPVDLLAAMRSEGGSVAAALMRKLAVREESRAAE